MRCILCGHEFFYGNATTKYCLTCRTRKSRYSVIEKKQAEAIEKYTYEQAERDRVSMNIYKGFEYLINAITADDDPIEFGRALREKFIELTGQYPEFSS